MIKEAVKIINDAYEANNSSKKFYKAVVFVCIALVIIIAAISAYVEIWLGVIEIVIVPALCYAIRNLKAADRNNVTILRESGRVLRGARSQIELGVKLMKGQRRGS